MLSREQAEHLWRSNDIAARIVEVLPDHSVREGFNLVTPDVELTQEVMRRARELQVVEKMMVALKQERAFGGAAIMPIADNTGDLDQPLIEENIVGLTHFLTFEPHELHPHDFYSSPLEPKFGEPKNYRLYPKIRGGFTPVDLHNNLVHESRLIVLPGIRVSRQQISPSLWGDSVLARPYAVLRDFGVSWDAVGNILTDFVQTTIKMKHLAEIVAGNKKGQLENRIRGFELSRSVLRATLIDSDNEEFERKQTPVSGLPELLDRFESRVAAAAEMPVTFLMGRSPTGLNATGQSDIEIFNMRAAAYQAERPLNVLTTLFKWIMLDRTGPTSGELPDNWAIKFNPLKQQSALERAQFRNQVAQTDQIYFNMGVLSADEIAKSRWGNVEGYSDDVSIDFEERERIAREEEQENEQIRQIELERLRRMALEPAPEPDDDTESDDVEPEEEPAESAA